MATYDVAPHWTNPWLKTGYLGQVVVLEQVPDVAPRTDGAVTCQFYLFREFLTETNYADWFDPTEIQSRLDYQDVSFNPIAASRTSWWFTQNCYIRVQALSPTQAKLYGFFGLPLPQIGSTIIGHGFWYSIDPTCNPDTIVDLYSIIQENPNPAAGASFYAYLTATAPSPTWLQAYTAWPTPYVLQPGAHCSMQLGVQARANNPPTPYVYVKGLFVRFAIPY